jgi:hypothetical protein
MWGIQRLSNIRVHDKSPHLISGLDPKLFSYPYLYIVSPHRMYLTREEAAQLREYLLRGGFLHWVIIGDCSSVEWSKKKSPKSFPIARWSS